ncbi:NAD(P)H-dependent glycerol-3-phosphate dehydrogenase [Roseococcus sp. DSY-14]|uniref:NAD(P)H-dependent glycerol-3-phosphate dehydrogenase n=1 Tax=Roseococcus sp. DSY-14 TaxID=3369650 RepID=UPI00387B86B3
MARIAVLGGGSFGTAVAAAAARGGEEVALVCRTARQAEAIGRTGRNADYFPDIALPPGLRATAEVDACRAAEVLFLAIPARHMDDYMPLLSGGLRPGAAVVNLVKGLDTRRLTFAERFAQDAPGVGYVALKGPTFARPLLLGEYSGLTIGTADPALEARLRALFGGGAIDFDSCASAAAVDAVSALKNIYAIMLGVLASLNLSDNTRFMFITRVLAEARQVMEVLGFDPGVVSLYCGVGDILLTGSCDTSRNRTLGLMIGKGIPVDPNRPDFLAEGVRSVRIIAEHLPPGAAPLIGALTAVLDGAIPPGEMPDILLRGRAAA